MIMTSETNDARAKTGDTFWENVRTIVYALCLAMLIRFTIAQPFRIPSGSMQPTLEVGDYIVVTKWSYGYSRFSFAPLDRFLPGGRLFNHAPKRGDIVVFRPNGDTPVTVYSRRNQGWIFREFGSAVQTTTTDTGAALDLRSSVAPTRLGVSHLESEQTGLEDIDTRHSLPSNAKIMFCESTHTNGPTSVCAVSGSPGKVVSAMGFSPGRTPKRFLTPASSQRNATVLPSGAQAASDGVLMAAMRSIVRLPFGASAQRGSAIAVRMSSTSAFRCIWLSCSFGD